MPLTQLIFNTTLSCLVINVIHHLTFNKFWWDPYIMNFKGPKSKGISYMKDINLAIMFLIHTKLHDWLGLHSQIIFFPCRCMGSLWARVWGHNIIGSASLICNHDNLHFDVATGAHAWWRCAKSDAKPSKHSQSFLFLTNNHMVPSPLRGHWVNIAISSPWPSIKKLQGISYPVSPRPLTFN